MINSITNNALYALNKASSEFEISANKIVTATNTETAENRVNVRNERNIETTANINNTLTYPQVIVESNSDMPSNSIAANIVNMNLAKTSYTAAAKLIKTADEMSKAILEI